jgi:MFS transporter, MHS family, alpha-ketoglutarate permease
MASRLRAIVSGSIGNLVEWYDWYAYSAFTVYFAPSFFPDDDRTVQYLKSAALFAVGFLVRPLGGWLLGAYSDKHGRRAGLLLSVLLMGGGSLMIACTPAYALIGWGAPALLLLARLLQGLSVGGEYGTSATYLSEVADANNRGFWSSFQYVTLLGGQLVALLVQVLMQTVLSHDELRAWGWRVPFVIGALAATSALWLRRSMPETDDFERTRTATHDAIHPLRALAQHPRAVLTVVGLTLGGTIAFYTFTNYAQKFLVNTTGFSESLAAQVSLASLILALILQPLLGALSDRIGRRPVLLFFGIGATLGTVPLLTLLSRVKTGWEAFGLLAIALLIVSGYTSINAIVKAELFPTRVRALGVGLPHALTVAIFGGTAEMLALWAKKEGVEPVYYWYVAGCAAVSLLVYWWMPETKGGIEAEGNA